MELSGTTHGLRGMNETEKTTTPEVSIIRYLLLYKYYNKYYPYVYEYLKKNKESRILLETIDRIFKEKKENKDKDITIEELDLYLLVNYSNEYESIYKYIVASLSVTTVSEELLEKLLNTIKDRQLANDLAIISLEVSEGKKPVESILDHISLFSSTETVHNIDDQYFVSMDLENLYEHQVKKHGLRWRLPELNKMLGSLRKGDFGFIFARPETGKTTFLASEVSYFAQQTEQPIIWFNNEEQGEKVGLRIYQATLGYTLQELFSDVKRNRRKYEDLVGNKILLYDSATISRYTVERLCKELQPSLVVFDQIDKIKGFDGDREDLRLGDIYIWAREIAKNYCPVIGVSQANGEGEGRLHLTMEHVANARTAKQAEADWILGIGKRNDEQYEYLRGLHLSKNKLTGDEDTVANMRHGKEVVRIRPEIARFVSQMEN